VIDLRSHLTIAAIATPQGRSGVGIIRLSGNLALSVACALSNLDKLQPRHATLSQWWGHDGLIDSGICIYFPAPHSYTGEDIVELQAHGSPVVLQMLLKRCLELGCHPAEPGEFTRRAVLHGKLDLSQAEAVIACIDADTERAANQAQRQLQGEFGRKVEALMDEITGFLAHVEACLDFSEEEIPDLFLDQLTEKLTLQLVLPMDAMLATADFGERLFNGVRVAIVGAPNVGKSSLLNALSGHDRAIVSDIAGTTRDTLEIDFDIHGVPVRLVDTAGIRQSDDLIEREGVRRALESARQADLVIFVADASRPETWTCEAGYDVAVLNKLDVSPVSIQSEIPFIHVSAKTKEGLLLLVDTLANFLGEQQATEDVYITSHRHRVAIQQSQNHIKQAIPLLGQEATLDLAALHLRQAWSALGEILGVGDVEVILDRVFSEFCIGK